MCLSWNSPMVQNNIHWGATVANAKDLKERHMPNLRACLAAVRRDLDQWRAEQESVPAPTPEVLPSPQAPKQDGEAGTTWLTLAEAERISNVNQGVISRAVDAGLQGKAKRKVDSVDFNRWVLERSAKPEQKESAATVEKKLEQTDPERRKNR
jgi:hypothetical protein